MEGKIKWFKREKGYGFITGDDEKDYFVHYTALPEDQQDIRESDDVGVTFEVKEGRDGRDQASDIKFANGSNNSNEVTEE